MSSSLNVVFFVALVSAIVAFAPVSATDHIVGANKGWNPGVNYTVWAKNHTFYIGDYISFRYQKTQYNVFMVNETGYDNCTTEGALGNWTSGKDFIMLNDSARYFFICGNGQCSNGMKVSVVVHPLPHNATANKDHSTPNSTASAIPRPGFRAISVSLALLLFASAGL